MSNAIIYLGPESLYKNSSIHSYVMSYPHIYTVSTLDLHLMFNQYNFEDNGDSSPMTVTFSCFKDMINTLIYKSKDIIIKDWYFNYSSLEYIIKSFEMVYIKMYDCPIETYLKFYHQCNPWHKRLPDLVDEIKFIDSFKQFVGSPLLDKFKKEKNVTVSGIKSTNLSVVL